MNVPPSPSSEAAASDDPIAIEPGRSSCESMLITTDSFDEFITTYPTTTGEGGTTRRSAGYISEIQEELYEQTECPNKENADEETPVSGCTSTSSSSAMNGSFTEETNALTLQCERSNATDHLRNAEWIGESDHVFILSTAGKPIYTLHGNEDQLATIFGVMQALVSVVQSNEDTIKSIHAADGMKIVFLVKPPLTLVAVSKSRLSVQQIQLQLRYVTQKFT